jgi:hypothetical protein
MKQAVNKSQERNLKRPASPVRPAPVSLHPLSVEQALGALLRTSDPTATKEPSDKGRS